MRISNLVLFSILAAGFAACANAQNVEPPAGAGAGVAQGGDVAPPPEAAPVEDYKPAKPNDWFDRTQKHFGTYFQEEEAAGEFSFKNPRDKVHKFYNIVPSCTCAKTRILIGGRVYEIGAEKTLNKIEVKDGVEVKTKVDHVNVEGGESGKIKVFMEMEGVQGDKDADLQLMCSDGKVPVINLRWRATGATYFVSDPPEINLNEMTWTDKREFQFNVYSPLKEDFTIKGHEKLAKAMKVSWTRGKREDGRTFYTIKGTYGPGADERDSGGQIVLKTDFEDKTVTVNVAAFLKGPLEMKPGGFIGMGQIPGKDGKNVDVQFIPNGDLDLEVAKIEVVRLNLRGDKAEKLHFEPSKQDKTAKVTIKIDKGMGRGYITGMLKVSLVDKKTAFETVKEVMFNGFVR